MKLLPHEILEHLGFDVPEGGIEINPNDAYLMTSALRLAGETIDIARVPDGQLAGIHAGLVGIVAGWRKAGLVSPLGNNEHQAPTEESLMRLRATVAATLSTTFKKR